MGLASAVLEARTPWGLSPDKAPSGLTTAADRRGVCTHTGARPGEAPQKGDPDVPDIAEGSGGVAGVAGLGRRDRRRRDGGDRHGLARCPMHAERMGPRRRPRTGGVSDQPRSPCEARMALAGRCQAASSLPAQHPAPPCARSPRAAGVPAPRNACAALGSGALSVIARP